MALMILEKSLQHMMICLLALLLSLVIALPLSFYFSGLKNHRWSAFLIRGISLIQTMPGLAMIALIVVGLTALRAIFPIPTTGLLPGVIALSLYAISPIVTNTYTGIIHAAGDLVDVAKGLGMTDRQILFHVQIPYAIPMMMNGIRIAGVWTIGMGTLASLVGSGGLGDLILQGLRSMNVKLILAGTISSAFLAVFFELGMSAMEKWLTKNISCKNSLENSKS